MATIALPLSEVARTAAANLGYTSVKPEQESAIVSFLRGNDVFVSLPTPGGMARVCAMQLFLMPSTSSGRALIHQ